MLLTETREQQGNLIIVEYDWRITREQVTIINPNAAAYADQQLFGLPVGNITRVNDNVYSCEIILAAGVANVEGVIVNEDVVSFATTGAAGDETTKRYACVVRGPVMLNKNMIRATDPAGAAYNRDTIASVLSARGIVVRAEPDRTITY